MPGIITFLIGRNILFLLINRCQKRSQLLGNPHFYLKRVQNGYAPAYIMLSEKGVRMRFKIAA